MLLARKMRYMVGEHCTIPVELLSSFCHVYPTLVMTCAEQQNPGFPRAG